MACHQSIPVQDAGYDSVIGNQYQLPHGSKYASGVGRR